MAIKSIPGRPDRKTIRIRFVKNKAYDGVDYGPSYEKQIADVASYWARQFLRSGAAVLATEQDTDRKPNRSAKDKASGKAAGKASKTLPDDPDQIPSDFPGAEALGKAGITSFSALAEVTDLVALEGIGEVTAARIAEAMAEREAE